MAAEEIGKKITAGNATSLEMYRHAYMLDYGTSTIEGSVFESSFTKYLNKPTNNMNEKNCDFKITHRQHFAQKVVLSSDVQANMELIVNYDDLPWNLI